MVTVFRNIAGTPTRLNWGRYYKALADAINALEEGGLSLPISVENGGTGADLSDELAAMVLAGKASLIEFTDEGVATLIEAESLFPPPEADTLASVMSRGATTALQLESTLAEGASPFLVTSATVNANLNADLLDGNHASAFLTSVTVHDVLSAVHGDVLADSVVRGDVFYGNATPKWARLAFPETPTGKVLQATATDVAWSTNPLTIGASASVSGGNTGDQTLGGLGGQPLDAFLTDISDLTDPGADRLLFWDDSDGEIEWLTLGNSIAVTAHTLDAIQDIRTTATPQFAGLGLGVASPDYTLELLGATAPKLALGDTGLAHGVTSFAQTDSYFVIEQVTNAAGGARLWGFSSTVGQNPLRLIGVFGNTNPTDSVPGIWLLAGKRSGAGLGDLGAAETVLQVGGAGTGNALLTLLGSGSLSAVGGLHVGGTSDPGEDNLAVDGFTYLTGPLYANGSEQLTGYFGQLSGWFYQIPSGVQSIVAATGITIAMLLLSPVLMVAGSGGPVTITANPRIAAGTADGMLLTLIGTSDTNTVTIANGNGIRCGASVVLDSGAAVTYRYSELLSAWIQCANQPN